MINALVIFNLILVSAMVITGQYLFMSNIAVKCPSWPMCTGSMWLPLESPYFLQNLQRLMAVGLGFVTLLVTFLLKSDRNRFKWALISLSIVVVQGAIGYFYSHLHLLNTL